MSDESVGYIVCVIVFLAMTMCLGQDLYDCKKKGGVMVRGVWGYDCLVSHVEAKK